MTRLWAQRRDQHLAMKQHSHSRTQINQTNRMALYRGQAKCKNSNLTVHSESFREFLVSSTQLLFAK